jgi:hypothetical protein
MVSEAYSPASGDPPADGRRYDVLPAESEKCCDRNYMKQNDKEDRVPVDRVGFCMLKFYYVIH